MSVVLVWGRGGMRDLDLEDMDSGTLVECVKLIPKGIQSGLA